MVSKKIYIVRHGQTDFNKNGIIQGMGVDASLNDTGRQQAQAFFEAYQTTDFDLIFTSTLKRTAESVKGFIDKGITTKSFYGLNEISWGSYDGKPFNEMERYFEICGRWSEGETALKAMDGESPEDVANRQLEVIQQMKELDFNKLLICMHGRAIRILLCQLLNKDLKEMDSFEHHNLGLYVIKLENGKFELDVYNSITHLQ